MFNAHSSSMKSCQDQVFLRNKGWLNSLFQVAIYKNIMQFQSSSRRKTRYINFILKKISAKSLLYQMQKTTPQGF